MITTDQDHFSRHPILPDSEVYSLLTSAQDGDGYARNRLIQCHYKLVKGLARRYALGLGVDEPDLISRGLEIVNRSITAYDGAQGVPFPSYLTKNVARGLSSLAKAERKKRMPVDRDQVGDDGSWLENITEDDSANQEMRLYQERLVAIMPRFLGNLVDSGLLAADYAEALSMRYGLDGKPQHTNAEIDAYFGMSKGWARVTLSRCLSEIGPKLEGKGLDDFL
ncbi:sigma-70 family RNA polymerase sigma factor [archaeon]|jgi:RNA polymerase sigma factor (sigma-70 family)|nr:sigma-70 family RNA polymerase sigma factor [archaeon]MBT4397563.1 sigma-70 family RNA polymerase sigma factor [archaeon]MBT4440818.1 sigma-70 family RNA polymerase sigma factor [archaeon]